jgi:hypothetical protein
MRWQPWAGRLAPGLGYAAGLTAGAIVLGTRSAATRSAWQAWASTNLVNLRDHPVRALVVSAFVSESDPVGWIALGLVGLTATAWVLGGWRTTLLAAAGHVVGTLVSEGILAYRIGTGAAPAVDRHLMDIGASYVVVCALAAGIVYSRWPGRALSAAGFLLVSPNLFGGLPQLEVSSVGHVTAIAVALGLGWPLWRYARRSRPARAAPETGATEPAPASS